MDKIHGIKYPKTLADSETSSRQKFITQLPLFNDEELKAVGRTNELKKTLFSFNASEGLLFDGLCGLCMDAYDSEHPNLLLKIETGTIDYVKVIERQNSPTETHYRSVLSLEEIQASFCGEKYKTYWPYVFDTLKKMAYEPPKKKNLVLGKKLHIETIPFNIDLIYEDGSSYKKIKTLSPRRTKKQIAAGIEAKPHDDQRIIVGMAIDYYKPLFAPVIEISKNKKPGRAYIVTPPYFQLSILDTFSGLVTGIENGSKKVLEKTKSRIKEITGNAIQEKELDVITNLFNSTIAETAKKRIRNTFGITPLEIRRFYLYLALHDNHRGTYITIENLIDFVESCFPGLIETNTAGERKLYPSRYKQLIENYINPILFIYKMLTKKGDMNGGQLVPLKIALEDTKTGEKFGRENNTLRIECMKSKSFFSTFTIEGSAKELIEMSRTINGQI